MKENQFQGKWHICEMEMWDEDYFNMEVQAFIEIEENDTGNFQFGLVAGWLDGERSGNRLEFTWDGNDECDEAQGSGWIELKDENTLEGKIKIHHGDSSTFEATRAIRADLRCVYGKRRKRDRKGACQS
jgi:hypothetical protein